MRLLLLLAVLCAPAHVAVEEISAPRNIFILLLVGRWGVCARDIDALRRRVAGAITVAAPPLTRRSFHRSLAGWRPGA